MFHPNCSIRLRDHELTQLTEFLRGFRVNDESVEYALEALFGLGCYYLDSAQMVELQKQLPDGRELSSASFQ